MGYTNKISITTMSGMYISHMSFFLFTRRNPIPPQIIPKINTSIAIAIGSTKGARISCACPAPSPNPPTEVGSMAAPPL